MYGLCLLEARFLEKEYTSQKMVVVELEQDRQYVNVNQGVTLIQAALPGLAEQRTASMAVLVVYTLGGCDYVSSIYNVTYVRLLQALLQCQKHVSTIDDPLLSFEYANDSIRVSISNNAVLRLLCCVYLEKYKILWKHLKPDPPSLYEAFKVAGNNQTQEMKDLMQWLGCPPAWNHHIQPNRMN